jgi:hypothetical protein
MTYTTGADVPVELRDRWCPACGTSGCTLNELNEIGDET